MKLHHRFYACNAKTSTPLLILHGLFGSNSNWANLARQFSATREVYALDLRNHGQSPHANSMNFAEMTSDVLEFIQAQGLSECDLLGHSMGGKVAMQLALNNPNCLNKLIIADIAPKLYPPRHQHVFAAIETIDNNSIQSRQQAEDLIREILPEQATRLFLITNLTRKDGNQLQWRSNMAAIRDQYAQISAALTTADNKPYAGPCLFIRGEKSKYITESDSPDIKQLFPCFRLTTIKDAGHWLHIEQAETFAQVVDSFLAES